MNDNTRLTAAEAAALDRELAKEAQAVPEITALLRYARNAQARAELANLHATINEADRDAVRDSQRTLYDIDGLPE